jgi:hypothetical protein
MQVRFNFETNYNSRLKTLVKITRLVGSNICYVKFKMNT